METLFKLLSEHPELASSFPVIPCALLAALEVEDDAARDTRFLFAPRPYLRLEASMEWRSEF